MSQSGFVAVLVVDLHFPEAGSLKAKRKDLQSIKAILQGRFGAAASEVAFQDLWQRARLLVSVAGGTASIVEERAQHIRHWIDARCPQGVSFDQMIVSVEDLRDVVSTIERGG
jgi:uncharacterized protein YlxP (DUF503 family)